MLLMSLEKRPIGCCSFFWLNERPQRELGRHASPTCGAAGGSAVAGAERLITRRRAERLLLAARFNRGGSAGIAARRPTARRAYNCRQILQLLRTTVIAAQCVHEVLLPAIDIIIRDNGEQRLVARSAFL